MATIYYEILSGTPPFKATINPPVAPDQEGIASLGIYYFSDVPDGSYLITVTDVNGCTDEVEASVYCPLTSTTTSTSSTTTTSTTCPPTDLGCVPSFDSYTTPSVAVLNVGSLTGCTYDDYVIDWYNSNGDIVLTSGKTANNPDGTLPIVSVIHPIVNKPLPSDVYRARIRYVIIGGVIYYPTSPPEDPCVLYYPGLDIDLAIIEITSIVCGLRNLPVTSDYDYGISYNVGVDYKLYSDFTIELADGDTSGYLAIYFAADSIPDQVQVYWGDVDGPLLAWYVSGSQIGSSEEGSPAYLAGNGRKAVISFNEAPYKPYVDGQILTVRVISNVNTNTKWTLYTKCLPDDAFPETHNYFPVALREVHPSAIEGIRNITVVRNPLNCIYTMQFDIPCIVMDDLTTLQATNFYKYTDLYQYTVNGQVNLSTGHVTVTFDRGTRMWVQGMWTVGGDYKNQIDTPGTCGDCVSPCSSCKGFFYSWDLPSHTMNITVYTDPYVVGSTTYYSKYYYDWKGRYETVMLWHKYGTTRYCDNQPFVDDVQSIYYYKMLYMGWQDSIQSGGIDLSCGDGVGDWHNFAFHYKSTVSFMGLPCDPATDITPSGFSSAYKAALAALEKVGGVEQIKTISIVAYDTGAENYTTSTTTTDIYGNGSCDFRNSDTWNFIHSGLFKQVEDCYELASYSGRSICTCKIPLSGIYFCEVNYDETVKYINPYWYTTLKSIMDTTCNALVAWKHDTNDPAMLAWEYWYYLAYLKITLINQYDYKIEDYLEHLTGEVSPTGVVLYEATTTTTTTLP